MPKLLQIAPLGLFGHTFDGNQLFQRIGFKQLELGYTLRFGSKLAAGKL